MRYPHIVVSEEKKIIVFTRCTGILHVMTAKVLPYIEYVKKTCVWLNRLAKQEQLNSIWVYWDYLWAVILHRCLIRQYVIGEFWKLSNPERRKRLTYSRMVKLFDHYNDSKFIHFLNEKQDFNAYFKQFVHRDWLYLKAATEEQFVTFLHKHDTVIIKPVDGVEGGGVRKFVFSKNSELNTTELYTKLQEEDVLMEEMIKQHQKMVFGNASVNTVRTHTVLDSKGKAHVIKAILRAGVGNTVVDNYCQGGSIYEVDLKTGIVCTYGQSKNNVKSYVQPGTDIVMVGYRIPNWDIVVEQSELAAEQLPQIRIIGWDIAITENGVELIEGNHNLDYELLEFLGSTGYYEKIKSIIES